MCKCTIITLLDDSNLKTLLRDTLHLRTTFKKRIAYNPNKRYLTVISGQSSSFGVNGEQFLTSCSTFGSQLKTGSDVERRTRQTSSIIIILRKIGCATKKLFVSRVALKYSAGLTLKIPLKTLFLFVSNFSVRFFT